LPTHADDKELRKALAFDFAESAGALWSRIDLRDLTVALLRHPVECITISDLDISVRDAIDHVLRVHPSYVGTFEIDGGNPVMLSLAGDLLPVYYRFDGGVLLVRATEDDDDSWHPSWSDTLHGPPGTRRTDPGRSGRGLFHAASVLFSGERADSGSRKGIAVEVQPPASAA
jgi:hypothetical protein